MTVIDVPFWWNWDQQSIIASIKQKRPELLPDKISMDSPISQIPPDFIKDRYLDEIPGLGLPMLATPAPKSNFNPTNWWIFEKYDGLRAIWNAGELQFYSRFGKPLRLPNYISDVMPSSLWLDGEIWFGRGTHNHAMEIGDKNMQYMVFDSPVPCCLPFEKRYSTLRANILEGHPFAKLAPYQICTSTDIAESMHFSIKMQGGEGIILRKPEEPYVNGYTPFLCKHEGFKDSEAFIVKQGSRGKFICRISKSALLHNEGGIRKSSDSTAEPNKEGESVIGIKKRRLQHAFDSDSDLFDIEMYPDPSSFTAETSKDIMVGKFVTFTYLGDGGIPVVPKVSNFLPISLLHNNK